MENLKIEIGNILDYVNKGDVIINSTNEYMIAGSGVCGAIYKRAGKDDLEKYCKNKYNKKMMTNEIRITPGFKLGIDIINIFVPKYYQQSEPLLVLVESYNKIFESANKNNYKNILTVSIGTGVHGYSHNEVAEQVIKTLDKLTKKYDIKCIMVLPSVEIGDIYKKYINV